LRWFWPILAVSKRLKDGDKIKKAGEEGTRKKKTE
jgi:hypothetical protein